MWIQIKGQNQVFLLAFFNIERTFYLTYQGITPDGFKAATRSFVLLTCFSKSYSVKYDRQLKKIFLLIIFLQYTLWL